MCHLPEELPYTNFNQILLLIFIQTFRKDGMRVNLHFETAPHYQSVLVLTLSTNDLLLLWQCIKSGHFVNKTPSVHYSGPHTIAPFDIKDHTMQLESPEVKHGPIMLKNSWWPSSNWQMTKTPTDMDDKNNGFKYSICMGLPPQRLPGIWRPLTSQHT